MVKVVQEYFEKSKLFEAFNSTVVTLIPKHARAVTIRDYRPIAGCTTFYKIVSIILTNRLGKVLKEIIHPSQAAFIPGQNIHNHILLATELLKGYSRKGRTPKCMLQLDLHKAYDMVDWNSLDCIFHEIGMPQQFIDWIMLGTSTVTYRFNINGEYSNVLSARRGIRQEDPISPFLFVIIMEYLNRVIVKMQVNPNFNHHSKCEKLGITHLSFVDDVLLFSRGDPIFINLILSTFQDFSDSTGLSVNPHKCKVFSSGMEDTIRDNLKQQTGFNDGTLPVRYLGVPLSCKKLHIVHYLLLIEKIIGRIRHWSNNLMSIAGRIMLVKSIFLTITQY